MYGDMLPIRSSGVATTLFTVVPPTGSSPFVRIFEICLQKPSLFLYSSTNMGAFQCHVCRHGLAAVGVCPTTFLDLLCHAL